MNRILEYSKYVKEVRTSIEKLSLEKFLELFKSNCKYYGNIVNLYRGTIIDSEFVLVDPKTSYHRQGTNNDLSDMMIDHLESFEKYPKRRESLFCSTSYNTASDYAKGGATYLVIPYKGAMMGIYHNIDVLWSFRIGDITLGELVRNIFKDLHIGKIPKTFKELVAMLDVADIKKEEAFKNDNAVFNFMLALPIKYTKMLRNMKFIDFIKLNFTPERLKFEYQKIENIKNVFKKYSYEVWTSSPCLMLNLDKGSDNIKNALEIVGKSDIY